ncbi:type IV secretory system conjugative DNA transfer family protein [Alteromonas sp. 14N.309.X.WAT.G.H12]|uniref:type IV secretory system conjugative DNA transfer family protein n=1 Tax=Alteromonas sp. 14N.309.X.WAT.G.H12 TaxID=3120824 RepID=UPI002FD1C43F
MKRLSILSAIIALSLCTANVHGQEDKDDDTNSEKYDLTNKEEAIVDTSLNSFRVNELKELYSETAKKRIINFDREYVKDVDYDLRSTVDFSHPSLGMLTTEITESDLEAIQEIQKESEAQDMRNKTIMQSAFHFGYAAAYYKRTREKHDELISQDKLYTQTFPFYILMEDHGRVKPPVVLEIPFSREIEDKRTIRETKRRYRIAKQAEVTLRPPTYLDYFNNLLTKKPDLPSVYMIPLNDEELVYWRKGIMHGWVEGNEKANIVIQQDIRTLFSEFIGMLRYHAQVRAHILNRPSTKNTQVGTNALGNVINIGESVFEITRLPEFNDDDIHWIALPEVDDIFNDLTQESINELTQEIVESGALN